MKVLSIQKYKKVSLTILLIAGFGYNTRIFSAHEIDLILESQTGKSVELASPAVNLRRMSLLMRGTIPRLQEVQTYTPEKHAQFAATFLRERDTAHYWSEILGSMLRDRSKMKGVPFAAFQKYLAESIDQNKPYKQLVKEMLTAKGEVDKNPAGVFYVRDDGDPLQIAEYVGRVFYGRRMSCARCHDHPYDKNFSRRDYYGLAAFFSQTWVQKNYTGEFLPRERREHFSTKDGKEYEARVREWNQNVRRKMNNKQWEKWRKQNALSYAVVAYEPALGLRFPYSDDAPGGDMVDPRFPYGERPVIDEGEDRRMVFVRWLTSRKNDRFRKVIINRIWTNLMGWSFFTPLDDWAPDSEVKYPELLEHLDKKFVEQDTRLKDLMYYIVTSRSFQRREMKSEDFEAVKTPEQKWELTVTNFPARRLNAYQVFNSLRRGSQSKTLRILSADGKEKELKFNGEGNLLYPLEKEREYENSVQIPKPVREHSFLSAFGAGQRQDVDDDESSLSIDQILELLNGRTTNTLWRSMSHDKDSVFRKNFEREKDMTDVYRLLYLSLLSREPGKDEMDLLQEISTSRLQANESKFNAEMLEDLAWSLANSKEFNHVF
ncbi:MAG: DUF1553 domain-containing protein [Leptospiraceae bacterium]|nr:DUF1553 domain-containing protein [Leptospiraceae bacterium]